MERRFINELYIGASEPDYNHDEYDCGVFKVGCLVVGYANPVMYIYPRCYTAGHISRKEIMVPVFM